MLDMQPIRGFYVDNLIEGKLDQTVAVAEAGQGQYPPGSVVQLVPGEVMVKHPKGYSEVTKDWEFFELEVSPEGTTIGKRGVRSNRLHSRRGLTSKSAQSVKLLQPACR